MSRTRVTQVLNLLQLPNEIRQYVTALSPREQRLYSGRRLREVVALPSEPAQINAFEDLVQENLEKQSSLKATTKGIISSSQ